MKHTVTREQITAINNLITVAEEQHSTHNPGRIDADDIILKQSIDVARSITNKWELEDLAPSRKIIRKGWHWVEIE